jgi:hypothetical protein
MPEVGEDRLQGKVRIHRGFDNKVCLRFYGTAEVTASASRAQADKA